jgi:hypothetical protein
MHSQAWFQWLELQETTLALEQDFAVTDPENRLSSF